MRTGKSGASGYGIASAESFFGPAKNQAEIRKQWQVEEFKNKFGTDPSEPIGQPALQKSEREIIPFSPQKDDRHDVVSDASKATVAW